MDLLHQYLRPELLLYLRGEIVSPGLAIDHEKGEMPDRALAPAAPPTDFVERLRRACQDDGITVYMRYPGKTWHLGAIGWFNRLSDEEIYTKGWRAWVDRESWNRDCTAIMPMLDLRRADGSPVVGTDICDRLIQDEAIVTSALASCVSIDSVTGKPIGVRAAKAVLYEVAKHQLDRMQAGQAASLDAKRQRFSAMPWWVRSQIRDAIPRGTSLRQERVAATDAHARRHHALTERHIAPWRRLVSSTERMRG